MHTIAEKKLLMLKPSQITVDPNQPRKSFDEIKLNALCDSISKNGIIEPLLVRKSAFGKFELIAGERRLRAAIKAGVRRVPCVLHSADRLTAGIYAVTENLQRCDLNFFEEAAAIERLIVLSGESQAQIAEKLGLAQSSLSNKLRLLKLDNSLKSKITEYNLSERHARALLSVPAEDRSTLLDMIINEGLNVRQTTERIAEILAKNDSNEINFEVKRPEPIRKTAIGDEKLFRNSLNKLVGFLQSSGVDAKTRRTENDKYIEYKVRIPKLEKKSQYTQLKIC